MIAIKVLLFIMKSTFMAFGGGNALFPFIRKEAVGKHNWMTGEEFDKLIVATNLIPGPSVVEALSYISIKVLGKPKGVIISLIGILPHVLFALGLFILAQKYIPKNYLFVINISVMPVIIGILLAFSKRFIKLSNKEVGLPLMIVIIVLTMAFSLFIPSPWNIPAFVMVFIIIIVFIANKIKEKRGCK